jgi:orotidine-5'-phosphate decarboxylase
MNSPIILALDGVPYERAIELARRLSGLVWGFKVNDLFVGCGPSIANELLQWGNVMLDLKVYDIPNTAANIGKKIATNMPGVQIVTAHAHGGSEMLKALSKELPGKVAAVTVLTSFSEEQYQSLTATKRNIKEQVELLAAISFGCDCGYVVCSGQELETLKHGGNGCKFIIPGIRPKWHMKPDDQKRTMTPKEAIQSGASLLVIGRPILEAENPEKAAQLTNEEIA